MTMTRRMLMLTAAALLILATAAPTCHRPAPGPPPDDMRCGDGCAVTWACPDDTPGMVFAGDCEWGCVCK